MGWRGLSFYSFHCHHFPLAHQMAKSTSASWYVCEKVQLGISGRQTWPVMMSGAARMDPMEESLTGFSGRFPVTAIHGCHSPASIRNISHLTSPVSAPINLHLLSLYCSSAQAVFFLFFFGASGLDMTVERYSLTLIFRLQVGLQTISVSVF
jgi:hypothetical protein